MYCCTNLNRTISSRSSVKCTSSFEHLRIVNCIVNVLVVCLAFGHRTRWKMESRIHRTLGLIDLNLLYCRFEKIQHFEEVKSFYCFITEKSHFLSR